MTMSLSRAAMAAAMVASCVVFGNTNASAVTSSTLGVDVLPDSVFLTPFQSSTPIVDVGVNGSVDGQYRSPFAVGGLSNQSFVNQPGPGTNTAAFYQAAEYNSVRNTGGSITYQLDVLGAGASAVSLIWGSPDLYNTLSFYDQAGALLDSFTGAVATPPGTLAIGNVHMAFTADPGEVIYRIVFQSTQAAFEYANFLITPNRAGDVPLPPALILFGSALVGLTLLGRRRRAARSAAV